MLARIQLDKLVPLAILGTSVTREGKHVSDQPAMSAEDAAKFLGTSKKTVLRAFHGGEIKGYRLSLAPKSPVVLYTESVESFDRRRKERQGAAIRSNGA
jgi:hypothetical protein